MRVLAGAAVLVAAAALPVAAQLIARPPNGTYTYKIVHRGKQLATSQIEWSADANAIMMTETANIGTTRYFTQTTFDPASMHERSYKGGTAEGGQANAVIDDDTVTLTFEGDARSFRLLKDTASIMIDDALVGFSAALPAVARADTANGVTALVTALPEAVKATISPLARSVPAGVPPGDAGINVILLNVSANLWFDKTTLVLDRLEDTTRGITFERVIP
jgi:hypothetical protein